jgi:soluble lytic murein transglycosylase-like protein
VRRLLTRLIGVAALACVTVLAPATANVKAALPCGVHSGEHVRWTPAEIVPLAAVLRAEGADRARAAELAQIVHSESHALHLDPLYALALMKVESQFRASAVSRRGAVGLLQVRPETARSVVVARVGVTGRPLRAERLRDPRTNVALGLRYLRSLERQFADRTTALAAYNLGPTRVRHHLARGTTLPHGYTDRVLAAYRKLARRADASAAPARAGG